ncbi:HpcH/HpaI aldolase/citrate lyase family protein [Natronobiforma cellulositropha]|uniref:HpcH/HpaI aldolase/citrate lyase family protein n=1 Tax=Natronobiforma cellulositropha TaxID=1679076 RepID=UPI0021D5E1A3|nr:CoA ester lyase [Natronobiforma cellulositropha]
MRSRSVLFTPGDRPRMLRTALSTAADVVVFDLEDAVSPGRKAAARAAVDEVLAEPSDATGPAVAVRINPGAAGETDLEALSADALSRLDALVLPKVERASDVERVSEWLDARGAPLPVLALLETARGVLAAPEIAACDPVTALCFGAEDLAADIGASRTAEGIEVLSARQRVVIAASAHDCGAIDTVYTDFEDAAGLREESAFARQLGFDGKLAIHPAQIEPIHEAFAPTQAEREWAETVLEAAADAAETERGVFEVDGEMIDAPLLARARRVIELADGDPFEADERPGN